MGGGLVLTTVVALCLVACTLAQNDVRIPPRITGPLILDPLYYELGEYIIHTCTATGNPPPVYTWYKDDIEVQNSTQVKNYRNGSLIISSMSEEAQGKYMCSAKTTFSGGLFAVALSKEFDISMLRLDDWNAGDPVAYTLTEHEYKNLSCDNMPDHVGPVVVKWYVRTDVPNSDAQDQQAIGMDGDRLYVDSTGRLHFTYLKTSDRSSEAGEYSCALSSTRLGRIVLGRKYTLNVQSSSSNQPISPILQFSSLKLDAEGRTFMIGRQGRLECVYSGYDNGNLPITWQDSAGNTVEAGDRRYFESGKHVLVINNLVESDEERYSCSSINGVQSTPILLNVTAAPIWEAPLASRTVPQGEDAVFHCKARSASGENAPEPPKWYKNGERLDISYNREKFEFQDGKRKMIVKNVTKSGDIACFRCVVENSVGETVGDGCLNVILAIEITRRPAAEQTVEAGDIVDLTVLATSDPQFPVNYRWEFKNRTYEDTAAPPNVTYDIDTGLAYINTSGMNNAQMQRIAGLYRRVLYHAYQQKVVDVEVSVAGGDPPVAAAAFPYWIIALILALLILLIIIIICCCICCRRKMQEGEYPVDRKETAAGLDPETEAKESGFPNLSRADYLARNDHPVKKGPPMDIDGQSLRDDDDSFGSAEYGEEPTAFNEDGSFIGMYKNTGKAPVSNPGYRRGSESNV